MGYALILSPMENTDVPVQLWTTVVTRVVESWDSMSLSVQIAVIAHPESVVFGTYRLPEGSW